MTTEKPEPETYWDMVKDPDCAVRVRHLSHFFGRNRALDRVSFTVRRGDVFGLVGPNGAGKTTLLRILATLIAPTKGQAYVMHHSVRKKAHYVRINIGFMPDATGIKEDLTVWQYLNFYAALYRVDVRVRKAVLLEALELVGLEKRWRSSVRDLSLGMQQRLSLARLLIHDPKVLLLDEPAAGLDPEGRIELRELIGRLGSIGKTVLVSSHILADIGRTCTQVGILEKGHLVFRGHLSDLVSHASSKARRFRLTFARDRAPGAELLVRERFPEASLERFGDDLHVGLGRDPAEPGRLFSTLVAGGYSPLRFQEEEPDLEGAFMRLTKGEVA
ncbi:MAG: ABC transporter ATP-binding protein [Planctomycetota bacterium]